MLLSPHNCVSDNNMMGVMMRSRRSRPDRSDHTCHNRRRRGLREAARFPQRAGKRSAETSKVTIPNACAVGEGEQEAAALIPSLISVQNQLTQSGLDCSYGSVSVGSQAYSGLSTTTQLLHPLTRGTSARSRLCRDLWPVSTLTWPVPTKPLMLTQSSISQPCLNPQTVRWKCGAPHARAHRRHKQYSIIRILHIFSVVWEFSLQPELTL